MIVVKALLNRFSILASMPVNKANSAANEALCERDVVAIVAGLARELHPQRSRFIDVDASSRIERDLGIDRLGRTELAMCIERAFRVRLPTQTISEAETIHDLTGRGPCRACIGASWS